MGDTDLSLHLRVFLESLEQLLEKGYSGRYAVVGITPGEKEGMVKAEVSCWDTFHDAIQFGYDKYGLGPFMAQKIERLSSNFREYLYSIPRSCSV